MARKLRVEYPGAVYHVMNRGDRREPIFRDDEDRQRFISTLGETCGKTGWQVQALCLMPNHFHLVVETPRGNLVAGMKWFLGTYTGRFNRRHKVFGHLFSGRYKALVVDGSGNGYLKTVCDYVHLNPARAKLLGCEQALREYAWSSWPEYLKRPGKRWPWLRVGLLLGEYRIPQDSAAGRRQLESALEERRATEADADYKKLRRGWCLGTESFRKELLGQMKERMGAEHYGAERQDVDPSSGVGVDVPLITVESPLEVFAAMDPRTRRVAAAGKWWCLGEDTAEREDHATLYLPKSTSWWVKKGGQWVLDEDETVGVDEHDLGVVPVVPIVNRPRTVRPRQQSADGVSDLDPVIPLSDAACKIATDMMVAAEYHAMPRRYALGFAAEDFEDQNGNPIDAFSRVAGRVWATEKSTNDGASVGQFAEAQLGNFHDTLKLLGMLVASVSGLPPHYLGSPSDNPASADAIRSSEARLVKRAERKQRAFGGSWESVMRLALLFRDGNVAPDAARMETLWRDASTPTVAQKADAAVKLFTSHIVPRRQIWSDLGYTPVQQDDMESAFAEEAAAAAASFGLGPDPSMPGAPGAAPTGQQVPRGVIPVEPQADVAVDA